MQDWRPDQPNTHTQTGKAATTAKKETTVADPSFDIVSKVDRQELDNAVNQASKELGDAVRLPQHRSAA